jgi:hypothetical protein
MIGEVPPHIAGWVTGDTVTEEQAREVRSWRVDADMSWRDVADEAEAAWGVNSFGGNQLYGLALCWLSAKRLGEDPDADPWD